VENAWGQDTDEEMLKLVGHSPKMQEVARLIERIAATDIPVVICGESGSGKEVAARLIHRLSLRSQKPFLKVNCAAIPDELLVSELFGYERGSFTGAYNAKPGIFEMAHKGTIFLDEISELPLSLQPKLLQVLQDKQFTRLGAQKEISVDVRFISASNRSLETLVAERKFREDLYYRMNVITVQMPPLRDRRTDIPELAEHLARKHSQLSKTGQNTLPEHIIELFCQHDWPGNVREMENTIRKLLVMGGDPSMVEELPIGTSEEEITPAEISDDDVPILSMKEAAKQAARQAERDMILLALRRTNWNRKRAAELLQISYKAMLYKLKDAGLAKHAAATWADN
jgi:two-component system, NtrC family, response regulator AtoC